MLRSVAAVQLALSTPTASTPTPVPAARLNVHAFGMNLHAATTSSVPYRQNDWLGFLTFYIRGALPPEQMMPAIRDTIKRLDPNPCSRPGSRSSEPPTTRRGRHNILDKCRADSCSRAFFDDTALPSCPF